MELGAGLGAIGGATGGGSKQHCLIGCCMDALAVEKIDLGTPGDRHVAGHPLAGAFAAWFHGKVLVGLGVGEEEPQAGADQHPFDSAAPLLIVHADEFAEAYDPLTRLFT